MKIKVGGSASMKIMIFQYEPIEVTSLFEIEKEFSDEEESQVWADSETEKINLYLKNDLEKKAKLIAKTQSDLKKKIKDLI